MAGIAIVGAGLGALRAAEALRSGGWTGDIDVFGDEPHPPYTRPPLSKGHLADTGAAADLAFPIREKVADVRWHLSTAVEACSLDERWLRTAEGTVHRYDGLVVATGVRPRSLATRSSAAVSQLRTVDDAATLRARLAGGARLVVIGSGFIGCEVAATARTIGCEVDVVSLDRVPLASALGDKVGREIRRRHEGMGTSFHLGRQVAAVAAAAGGPRPDHVVLDDGTAIPADVILVAVGSQPNVDWLAGNGLDLSDGALCDGYLRLHGRTGAVAVGDVARFPLPRFGVTRRIEHWQIPGASARHAARTLLADLGVAGPQESAFSPVPHFWSDQGDIRVQAFGIPSLADATEVVEGELAGDAAVLYTREDRPVGVVLLGMPKRAAHYRRWLAEATELSRA